MFKRRAHAESHVGLPPSPATDRRPQWLLDTETGFPLPVLPLDKAPTVVTKHGEPYHKDPDDHHFFFPRASFNSPDIGVGGQIVRLSRIQTLRRAHHQHLHDYFAPPPLLDQPIDQFRLSVLALSNYLPAHAIDPRPVKPEKVALQSRQLKRLRERTARDFHVTYGQTIGRFFIQVMTSQYIGTLDEDVAFEFLKTSKRKRKLDLGGYILHAVTECAVSPLNPIYGDGKQRDLIPPETPSPFRLVTGYARQTRIVPVLERTIREKLPEAA